MNVPSVPGFSPLSTPAGTLSDTYTYDSFGKSTASAGTTANPFRYTGREFDADTGSYYYRSRYYNSDIGRFLSEDSLRFRMGTNFYRYVSNNPINETDPSGCGFIDCVQAVAELERAVSELLRRQAAQVGKCPDAGHNKAIEQARNRVRKALNAAKHCLSDEEIRRVEIVLGVAAVVIVAPEILPFLPEIGPELLPELVQ